jgi:hypothetical protein
MQLSKRHKMEKNKILENRPELTNEQIMQGMDFNKIKNNAALAKSALLKSLIIKGLLGVIILSSAVLVFINYKPSIPEKTQTLLVDTTKINSLTEKDSLVIYTKTTIDKKTTIVVEPQTQLNNPMTVLSLQKDTSEKYITTSNNTGIKADVNIVKNETLPEDIEAKNKENMKQSVKSKSTYKLNRFTKCKLWKPKSFCDIPKKGKLSSWYDADAAEYDYVSCQEANKSMAAMKAVWITIDIKGRTKLQLESQLKNILLVKSSNGKSLNPIMIAAVADGSTFFGKNFKAKKFVANYDNQLDIFLFFSEAEIGDTIIIKNFIETVILE